MKKLNKILLLNSALTFIVFQTHTLYASKITLEGIEDVKQSKFVKLEFSESLQDILQKIKKSEYVSQASAAAIKSIATDKLKKLKLTLTLDDDMFDSWINLILAFFPKDTDFKGFLKIAKEKGESESATPAAQYNLGLMYKYGEGINQDNSEAFKWIKKAAKKGQANAQDAIGSMYNSGQGINKNPKKSFKWYKKSAKQGYVMGQLNFGAMYLKVLIRMQK